MPSSAEASVENMKANVSRTDKKRFIAGGSSMRKMTSWYRTMAICRRTL
jgi:hypothetical protein